MSQNSEKFKARIVWSIENLRIVEIDKGIFHPEKSEKVDAMGNQSWLGYHWVHWSTQDMDKLLNDVFKA